MQYVAQTRSLWHVHSGFQADPATAALEGGRFGVPVLKARASGPLAPNWPLNAKNNNLAALGQLQSFTFGRFGKMTPENVGVSKTKSGRTAAGFST